MNDKYKALHEGKTKIIFPGPNSASVVQHFKDDVTAFNSEKRDILLGKGAINNRVSYLLMNYLEGSGVETHMLELLNDREQLVKKANMIPIEVVLRNLAAGSICTKFGIEQGKRLSPPIVELYYKNDLLSDPMVTEEHIISFGLARQGEISHIRAMTLKINEILRDIFQKIGITLVDFKLEFGRLPNQDDKIVLADEISPDTCRLWDSTSQEIFDKDLYRFSLGNPIHGYSEILSRLEGHFGSQQPI